MRILLADDQQKVRFALRVLLESMPEMVIVGEASDCEELLTQLETSEPELLILDWLLPGLAEAGSLLKLRELYPDLLVIAVSGRPELANAAYDSGADAFVSKIDPPERLMATVNRCKERVDRPRVGG